MCEGNLNRPGRQVPSYHVALRLSDCMATSSKIRRGRSPKNHTSFIHYFARPRTCKKTLILVPILSYFNMFWNRKSHQIPPTAESDNELTQGTVSEVVSPKGRERVRKRVLFLLLVSFLLIFLAVDILFDFHRTQEDMFRELETNLDITEDEIKQIVFLLITIGLLIYSSLGFSLLQVFLHLSSPEKNAEIRSGQIFSDFAGPKRGRLWPGPE